MKNKIALKLTLYFSAALLLFSFLIGAVFMTLFKNHTIEIYEADLEKRAAAIADGLSAYLDSGETGMMSGSGMGMTGTMGGRQGGYGGYLHFIDEIAMTDVWIVDENLQLLMAGHAGHQQYQYGDLPPDADLVVKNVFEGKTAFSRSFSSLLDTPTLTVGTPILSKGKVTGALLLHSPIEGMNEAAAQGFRILAISVLTALALSVLLSLALAYAFTKPLKKMQRIALQLAGGNYNVKTSISRKDEIGELASAIDALSEQLDQASQEREKLYKLRHDFIANISHELRTPVTVLRSSLEALNDEVVTGREQVAGYHRQMLMESLHLERLVNDLLDLSRLQNTDFLIEMQELSLCDVLNDSIRSIRQMAQANNIKILKEQDDQRCMVWGDYGRLRQMFLIILDNAVKFSPQNETISVSLKNRTVTIHDSGEGISEEDLPYIFDRFYKVESERNKTGTGLGLAIAKQIADRHHILISVNSMQMKGTEFRFQFP